MCRPKVRQPAYPAPLQLYDRDFPWVTHATHLEHELLALDVIDKHGAAVVDHGQLLLVGGQVQTADRSGNLQQAHGERVVDEDLVHLASQEMW